MERESCSDPSKTYLNNQKNSGQVSVLYYKSAFRETTKKPPTPIFPASIPFEAPEANSKGKGKGTAKPIKPVYSYIPASKRAARLASLTKLTKRQRKRMAVRDKETIESIGRYEKNRTLNKYIDWLISKSETAQHAPPAPKTETRLETRLDALPICATVSARDVELFWLNADTPPDDAEPLLHGRDIHEDMRWFQDNLHHIWRGGPVFLPGEPFSSRWYVRPRKGLGGYGIDHNTKSKSLLNCRISASNRRVRSQCPIRCVIVHARFIDRQGCERPCVEEGDRIKRNRRG